ncbi:MAG: outer membrane beta-barrel protein [Psychroserpens sp.]|uniref:outer membrane beta-barrel protein n=1 Tax=Psychroserpens sp. TaxID=2020870 RepID=UPI003C72A69C
MNFKKLLYLLLCFCFISSFAQKEITVSGTVIDATDKIPLEYATISLLSSADKILVTGEITNTKGKFSIDVLPGVYDVKIEYLSYKTITYENKTLESDIDLGTVGLELNLEALDAVEVVAETTTVEIKLDKKIYNIGKDLTTAGGTVGDALNNVPSVTVDIEGAISLRGNENVRILINGRPSALAGFGDSNVLSQLPAEAIERVEVITSPSARYDAEGTAGILNIILRQKETLGFNGSINSNFGDPELVGLATTLNYRTEKFNLFSNLGFRYFDAPRFSNSDANYFDRIVDGETVAPEYDRVREDQNVTRLNRNFNGNIGMEYFLSEKTSLVGSLFYRYGEDADESQNISDRFRDNLFVEQTKRVERQNEEDNRYQIALNYITKFDESGHQLNADFQYEQSNEIQFTNIDENYILTDETNPEPFQIEREFEDEEQTEILVQADYVLPLAEDSRFEAGFRGNFESSITDYRLEQEDLDTGDFIVNDAITNIFEYDENVTAVYSQYGSKFGKFSFLAGLRVENTQLRGKINSRLTDEELLEEFNFPIDTDFDNNFLGLFPTVNLIFNIGEDEKDQEESITLGYNRRINRPRGWFINPFPTRSSRTRIFQGNPNLNPAFSNAFDLGYLKRWETFTLTSSIYYQRESGSFERVEENTGQQTSDGIDIIRVIPINLATNSRTGAELGILYNPAKWLRINSSVNFFRFNTKGDFNGVNYDATNTSWFARFSSKVTLPANIDWQTNANYRGAEQDAQTDREGIFSMDLAFSKEIFKNKATLSLNVRDVFNSRIRRQLTTTEFFNRESESQWRVRQVTLSLIYRFNQQKNRQRERNNSGGDDFDFEG